jgi:hypothetical protein
MRFSQILFSTIFIVALLVSVSAQAVVISYGDGSGNTTAPADDFGFANVGVCDNKSAVYLGYGWVLTASHVPVTDVSFGGQAYACDPSSAIRLTDPANSPLELDPDLQLFKLTDIPYLPALNISSQTLSWNDEVIMCGHGYDRSEVDMETWDVDDGVWTESDYPVDYRGFDLSWNRTVRWGENELLASPNSGNDNFTLELNGETICYQTGFEKSQGLTYESQAVAGDSGGGVFYKNGDDWELCGIMLAATYFDGQDQLKAVYGTTTYSADLSRYNDQILNAITPIPGDANCDGMVSTADLAAVTGNWGMTGNLLWSDGDFNGDGVIGTADLAAVTGNWQAGVPSNVTVPEPTFAMMGLALLAMGVWSAYRSRFKY